MKTTDKHFKIIEQYAKMFPEKDDFVILRETSNGTRYLEWAFKEGRPHDYTCLSWYLKPHPKYLKKYPNTIIKFLEVGEVFHLTKFCCGKDSEPLLNDRCEVGSPKPECSYIGGKKWKEWDYTEPVKCACWDSIPITKEEIKNYYKKVNMVKIPNSIDILQNIGMTDDKGHCQYTAEEIFKAGIKYVIKKLNQ